MKNSAPWAFLIFAVFTATAALFALCCAGTIGVDGIAEALQIDRFAAQAEAAANDVERDVGLLQDLQTEVEQSEKSLELAVFRIVAAGERMLSEGGYLNIVDALLDRAAAIRLMPCISFMDDLFTDEGRMPNRSATHANGRCRFVGF